MYEFKNKFGQVSPCICCIITFYTNTNKNSHPVKYDYSELLDSHRRYILRILNRNKTQTGNTYTPMQRDRQDIIITHIRER